MFPVYISRQLLHMAHTCLVEAFLVKHIYKRCVVLLVKLLLHPYALNNLYPPHFPVEAIYMTPLDTQANYQIRYCLFWLEL